MYISISLKTCNLNETQQRYHIKSKIVMIMIFSIDLVLYQTYQNVPNVTSSFKVFHTFTCTNLDGSQKEGVNFLNLLQKEGGTQKGKGGFPQKRMGGGVPTLEETVYTTMVYFQDF